KDRSDDESERDGGGDRSNAGPMLLKNLAGTPFDDMKYLAKDLSWMNDPDKGEKLIALMDSKELYDDEREDMMNTLVKVTYTLRRTKGETNKVFFARWDNVVRRLEEHKVKLPEEYLGFLLTNALNLSNDELKLLLNFTQGRLKTKDVKEWLRVHDTEFENKTGKAAATKTSQVLHVGEPGVFTYDQDEEDQAEDEGVFDEAEATEILATMVKEHTKGGGKRSFPAVNKAKKAKALARGYGAGRDPNQRFREQGNVKVGGTYRVSIEALKRRTRCGICKEIGHWHRECPRNAGGQNPKESHFLESEEALFLDYIEYLD
ncbi:Ank2, partial [Symbiodinium sp. CCMP2592]